MFDFFAGSFSSLWCNFGTIYFSKSKISCFCDI